jgi:hypothetical protein
VYPLEVVRRTMQLQSAAQAAARAAHGGGAAGAAAADGGVPRGRLAAAAASHALGSGGAHARALAAAVTVAARGSHPGARVAAAAAAILRSEGLKGFYSGLAPNLLQVRPPLHMSIVAGPATPPPSQSPSAHPPRLPRPARHRNTRRSGLLAHPRVYHWRGCPSSLSAPPQVLPSAALSYYTYDTLKQVLLGEVQ